MTIINYSIIKLNIASVTNSFCSGLKKAFRVAPFAVLIFLGSTVYASPKINGILDGDSSQEYAEDARYERIYALWGGLLANAGETELPKWSVQEVLAFTTGVHMGRYHEFSERELLGILNIRNDSPFDVSGFGDPELRRQVRHIFEDASLLFYSLQENYRNAGDLSHLILPGSLAEADFFFAEALHNEIHLSQKTGFAENSHWQELAINGLWNKDEVVQGFASEKTLQNHALVQSILWVGRELIEKVRKEGHWGGPSAADFDKKTFVKNWSVGVQEIGRTNMNEAEVSLYWAIRGIIAYESQRVPLYDKTTGQLISGASAEVLLAQCFKRVYDSYSEALEPVEPFSSVIVSTSPTDPVSEVEIHQGTSVNRWIEARTIVPTVSISDKEAVNFLYANLPELTSGERNLLTLFNAIQGAGTILNAASLWASKYRGHPDQKDQQPGTVRCVRNTYLAAQSGLIDLGRSTDGSDLWVADTGFFLTIHIRLETGLHVLESFALAATVVPWAMIAASEVVIAQETASIVESGGVEAELLEDMKKATLAGDTGKFTSLFSKLSKLNPRYAAWTVRGETFGKWGARIGQTPYLFSLLADVGFNLFVSDSFGSWKPEVPLFTSEGYASVDLHEYFAAMQLALTLLDADYDGKDAAQVLSDYARNTDIDLSRITVAHDLIPEKMQTFFKTAFSGDIDLKTAFSDDIDTILYSALHSGNIGIIVDIIFAQKPGKRWPLLVLLYESRGIDATVDILAEMVEKSAATTAEILLEYQRSTLLNDHAESADSGILRMFLELEAAYTSENYQQQIIAAGGDHSLELWGDFFLDIGIRTGAGGFNFEAVAHVLERLSPLRAGLLLEKIYELEQERKMPRGDSLAEGVYNLMEEDDNVLAIVIFEMAAGEIAFQIKANNTQVNEYLENPVKFAEDSGDQLLINSGGGLGWDEDDGNDYLYRTMGRHVVSEGLIFWVNFLAEQLALTRDLDISHQEITSIVGAISLGTQDPDFMAEAVQETGDNIDVLAQLILGLLPNADLFPDENWAWLRGWFKNTAPHTLGGALDEAYNLNNTPDFESRATQNSEALDAITAEFLENMTAKDAAALLATMDAARAARVLALIVDQEQVAAILEAMAESEDPAIRGAFIAMMDADDDTDQQARLFLALMRNSPRQAWLRMYEGDGVDLNYYMTIILNTPHDNPNQVAEAFARMLGNASEEQRTTILRNLIVQGEGAFVGQVLSYMGPRILNRFFLNEVFSRILQDPNLGEQAALDAITPVLRSLLSQTTLGNNEINFNIRRILIFLSTIPVPGGDANSIRLVPVFNNILNSDLYAYFMSHMIDFMANNRTVQGLSSDGSHYRNTMQTRIVAERVLNALSFSPWDPQAFGILNLSDEEMINNESFRNTVFAIRVLFTRLYFDGSVTYPDFAFNMRAGRDRILNVIGLLAQRATQGTPEERLTAQRHLGRILMPIANPGMRLPGRGQGNRLIFVDNPDQARLGIIFNHFLDENRVDVIIQILNAIISSVDDDRHAYFLIERTFSSMIRNGQITTVGRILALIIVSLDSEDTTNLVLRLLERLRETQNDDTFTLILANMIAVLDQALDQALDEILADNVNRIFNFISRYVTNNRLANLQFPVQRPLAVIFTHLADSNMPAFSQWIITLLDPNNGLPITNLAGYPVHNEALITNLAGIFHSMMLYDGTEGPTNEVLNSSNTLINFVSTVLAPESGFSQTQISLLGPLFNRIFELQEQNEVFTFLNALADSSPEGSEYAGLITVLMASQVGGADNVNGLLQANPTGAVQETITAAGLAAMDSNSAATILTGLNPSTAGQILSQMIANGNLAAVIQIVESVTNNDYTARILVTMNTQTVARILSNVAPDLAANVIAYICQRDKRVAARILLEMETQVAVQRLVLVRTQFWVIYRILIDEMDSLNSDRTSVITDQINNRGGGRRDNVLSYVANLDEDRDNYWEPRDDDGALITNTDHHFTNDPGIRRLRTSHLNHAYYFDGAGGSRMESLQALAGDPTKSSASFELWIRPEKMDRLDLSEYLIFESGGQSRWVNVTLTKDTLRFSAFTRQGYRSNTVQHNIVLPDEKFSHIVGVIEDVNIRERKLHLYVNSEHAGSTSIINPYWQLKTSSPSWSDGTDARLGSVTTHTRIANSHLKEFKGWISEFHFYDRALSAEDISDHYRLRLATPGDITIETYESKFFLGKKAYELNWAKVAEADGYNIYRTEEAASFPQHNDLIGSTSRTRYIDKDVVEGRIYYYWITGHRHWEESDFSKTISSVSITPRSGGGGGSGRPSRYSVLSNTTKQSTVSTRTLISKTTNTPPAKSTSSVTIPNILTLSDYDGGGLKGEEVFERFPNYSLIEDENGDTVLQLALKADEATRSQVKQFDATQDISDYSKLSFDYHSTADDPKRTIQIQLRLSNQQNPGAENFWNWKNPVPLSAGRGEWTRASINLSEDDFKQSSDWQPGNEFNLDRLESIAVLIRSNDTTAVENTVHIDNIQVFVNEDE